MSSLPHGSGFLGNSFWSLSMLYPFAVLQSSIRCATRLAGNLRLWAAFSIRSAITLRLANRFEDALLFLHAVLYVCSRCRIDGDRNPSGPLIRPWSHSSHTLSTVLRPVLTS